jgi:valyl-tRNA synthetase
MALEVVVAAAEAEAGSTIEDHRETILNLARLKSLSVSAAPERPRASATAVARGVTLHVRLEGIIDFAKEIERLQKELGRIDKELASVAKKLNNQDFLAKAPAEVVAKVKSQQQELMDRQQKLQANLEKIKAYDSAS